MTGCVGFTFRPGGYADSFGERSILPAGTATMFRLQYDLEADSAGKSNLHIPVLGIKGRDLPTGDVRYDEHNSCVRVDLSRRPRAGSRGRVIDPDRNPSLLETALRIERACQRAAGQRRKLPNAVTFPRVLLGFTKVQLPVYQDTKGLRVLAAKRLGIPVQRLGSNGEILLDKLLRETWEQSILLPSDPRNWTGTYLVDSAICPHSQNFFRIYEDFSELLGEPAFNPARLVQFEQFANPANEVFREVRLGDNPDLNQRLADETITQMTGLMRKHLGDQVGNFSDEDILDGITEASLPLIAWSNLLPKLRAKLTVYANECCTDADLKQAARHPADALWVRNVCRVQVVRRQSTHLSNNVPYHSIEACVSIPQQAHDLVMSEVARNMAC